LIQLRDFGRRGCQVQRVGYRRRAIAAPDEGTGYKVIDDRITAPLLLPLVSQNDVDFQATVIGGRLGLEGISVELGLMRQDAHARVYASRISAADAALQVAIQIFLTIGIFFAEYFGVDRRLPLHHLVISLENRALADAVIGREDNAIGQRRQWLLLGLADASDVNRDRSHTETRPLTM
jgi:hypothetical protein